MKTSFYSDEELKEIGLKSFGNNVLISRFARLYSPETIEIGNNVRIDDFCILSGIIKLGNYIHIAPFTVLYGKLGIEMEECTGLSARCTVISASDDFSGNYLISPMVPEKFTNVSGGKVTIMRFAQVGAGSVILPLVTLKEGVAVGAMSLVKHDLEAWSIYAGNPIRFIKQRERKMVDHYKQLVSVKNNEI